jgi:hypothetical protein
MITPFPILFASSPFPLLPGEKGDEIIEN